MARNFNNLASLFNYIDKNIELSLKQVSYYVQEQIKSYIMQNLYKQHNPSHYDRTYEFLNSLTVSEVTKHGQFYKVKLYFDTDKISPYETRGSFWNQHADIDGNDVSNILPIWIEEGTKGSLWDREGIYMMRNTYNDLKSTKKHVHILKNYLKQKGIDVEVV